MSTRFNRKALHTKPSFQFRRPRKHSDAGALAQAVTRLGLNDPGLVVAALLELPPALGATPTLSAILRLIAGVGAIAVVLALPAPGDTEATPSGERVVYPGFLDCS